MPPARKPRTVLLLRVWHPDLSAVEVDALNYLFERIEEQRGPGSCAADPFIFVSGGRGGRGGG